MILIILFIVKANRYFTKQYVTPHWEEKDLYICLRKLTRFIFRSTKLTQTYIFR